jgi:hypothetical protein
MLDAIAPKVTDDVADADGLKSRQALGCGFDGLDAFHLATCVMGWAIDKLVGEMVVHLTWSISCERLWPVMVIGKPFLNWRTLRLFQLGFQRRGRRWFVHLRHPI